MQARNSVEEGLDEATKRLYDKDNTAPVFGGEGFKAFLADNKEKLTISGGLSQALSAKPSAEMIVKAVA